MKNKTTMAKVLVFLMLLGVGLPAPAPALTLPGPSEAFSYGDFYVYSLPVLQYYSGLKKEYSVKSTPGAIKDGIVIYTGSGGVPVNENFPNMDNAYPVPSGTYTTFRTGSEPDPIPTFSGDTADTWDTTLSDLDAYLDGDLYFFFNHNELNAADEQDLYMWGRIAIVDVGGILPTLYFELNNDTSGPDVYTAYPITEPDDPGDYVLSEGAYDLYGDGSVIINHNLGADEVAYVMYSPEINEGLAGWMGLGYDAMQIDFRMADLSNGFEQLFILNLVETTPVPEPGTMLLLGTGLIGLAGLGRKRFKRKEKSQT